MYLLRRRNGELIPVESDGLEMPDSQEERDEVYRQIREEVERIARGHEQPEPCASRRVHPSFRGRPRK